MGSGSSRKGNDKPLIKTPKKGKGSGGGSGGGSRSSESSAACPPAFEVKLPEGKGKIGQVLTLKSSGDFIRIFLAGEEIARLSRSKSIEISNCIKAGFQYPGIVKAKKDGLYGEFKRT